MLQCQQKRCVSFPMRFHLSSFFTFFIFNVTYTNALRIPRHLLLLKSFFLLYTYFPLSSSYSFSRSRLKMSQSPHLLFLSFCVYCRRFPMLTLCCRFAFSSYTSISHFSCIHVAWFRVLFSPMRKKHGRQCVGAVSPLLLMLLLISPLASFHRSCIPA